MPLKALAYHTPNNSRYCTVEHKGEIYKDDDEHDILSTIIKICNEIGLKDIIELSVKAILNKVNRKAIKKSNGDKRIITSTENYSSVRNNGFNTIAANAKGKGSVTTNIGFSGISANTGDFSAAFNREVHSSAVNTGDYSTSISTRDNSVAVSTGDCSVASNKGAFSAAINTGSSSISINTGFASLAGNTDNYSASINEGDFSAAINTCGFTSSNNSGIHSAAINIGDKSEAINTGSDSIAINMGSNSRANSTGCNSIAINIGKKSDASIEAVGGIAMSLGIEGRAKGVKGCWLMLAEWKRSSYKWIKKEVKLVEVDGEYKMFRKLKILYYSKFNKYKAVYQIMRKGYWCNYNELANYTRYTKTGLNRSNLIIINYDKHMHYSNINNPNAACDNLKIRNICARLANNNKLLCMVAEDVPFEDLKKYWILFPSVKYTILVDTENKTIRCIKNTDNISALSNAFYYNSPIKYTSFWNVLKGLNII